jgi:hypothetical protein
MQSLPLLQLKRQHQIVVHLPWVASGATALSAIPGWQRRSEVNMSRHTRCRHSWPVTQTWHLHPPTEPMLNHAVPYANHVLLAALHSCLLRNLSHAPILSATSAQQPTLAVTATAGRDKQQAATQRCQAM